MDEEEGSADEDTAAPLVDNDADGPRRFMNHHSRRRRETVMYRVGPGDTIVGVAKQFGIDADDVAHQNKLDGDVLKIGSLIKLKVRKDMVDDLSASPKDVKDEKPAPAPSKTHHGSEHREHRPRAHRDAT